VKTHQRIRVGEGESRDCQRCTFAGRKTLSGCNAGERDVPVIGAKRDPHRVRYKILPPLQSHKISRLRSVRQGLSRGFSIARAHAGGASLNGVADALGHQHFDTTAIHAWVKDWMSNRDLRPVHEGRRITGLAI
jgi:hypothetical protein